MQILADTNVLLRLVEPTHPHYNISDSATEVLRGVGHELVIVPQNMFEFWVVATRPANLNGIGMSPAEADDALRFLRRVFRLLRDERTIVDYWRRLVVVHEIKGKPAHDARLAAAMQRHSISHLLTFNVVDFLRFPFLTTLSPTDVADGTVRI